MTNKFVSDEQRGKLADRVDEVVRRVKEGTIDFQPTMDGLQMLIEDTSKFTLVNTFNLTVPEDYIHGIQLATVGRGQFYSFNKEITDENFRNATQRLVPGKTYQVKIFGIKRRVTSKECLALYRSQGAILTGAQGLLLAHQQDKEQFPVGMLTISFDEEYALFRKDTHDHQVPYVRRHSITNFYFALSSFRGQDWITDDHVLLFCDLPAAA